MTVAWNKVISGEMGIWLTRDWLSEWVSECGELRKGPEREHCRKCGFRRERRRWSDKDRFRHFGFEGTWVIQMEILINKGIWRCIWILPESSTLKGADLEYKWNKNHRKGWDFLGQESSEKTVMAQKISWGNPTFQRLRDSEEAAWNVGENLRGVSFKYDHGILICIRRAYNLGGLNQNDNRRVTADVTFLSPSLPFFLAAKWRVRRWLVKFWIQLVATEPQKQIAPWMTNLQSLP